MKPKPDDRKSVGTLAVLLHVSRQTLQGQLRAEGAPKPDAAGKYSLAAVKAFREARKAARGGDVYRRLAEERRRLAAAQADLHEIEKAKLRGELVTAEEVVKARMADAEVIKSDMLHTLPAAVAARANALGCDPARLRAAVVEESRALLVRWSTQGGPL
jgi:phage terminase Nu1 subunit (DNA packaging protein)